MTHAEMNELYELYLLGALEPDAAREIDEHLERECAHCLERLRHSVALTAAMAGLAEAEEPRAELRKRVVASVRPAQQEPRRKKWSFAYPAMAAICAALLVLSIWSVYALRATRVRLAALETERRQLQETVEILSRSDTRTVQFGKAEAPHGRVFVNRNRGLVFVGSNLPALASGRTFQLWLVPGQGTPESAGVFRANRAGEFVQVRATPVDLTRMQAVAVSVEPEGGSPAPTTTPILIVPLG